MISAIFKNVVQLLLFIANKTKLTYNEINIIIYYFCIPFSWLSLLDVVFGFHYFKIGFAVFLLVFRWRCRNFRAFSNWLFNKSVMFLNAFNPYGSSYIASSVWICVSLPILIYGILLYLIYR